MNGCIETDKPLISILMAVYEPRMDWFKEQLDSLNAQTYPNLRLFVRDDCSKSVQYEDISECVKKCITAFPYSIVRNERNLGSNETFEKLTKESAGDYFAYCDQDDVWQPEKLLILQETIEREKSQHVCSDMYVIDGNGKQLADSVTKVRRHHVFKTGANLASSLLFRNFVTGCTMLIHASTAKAAIPFCPYMVHDHYLALWSAVEGVIISVPEQLIYYRQHGNNQTGVMTGVVDKKSYGEVRIDIALNKLKWLKSHMPCDNDTARIINEGIVWLQARHDNWNHKGGAATVLKYWHYSPIPCIAELFLKYVSDKIFMKAIKLTQRNMI